MGKLDSAAKGYLGTTASTANSNVQWQCQYFSTKQTLTTDVSAFTTGNTMIAVRSHLCHAHILGRTAKRSFVVRIFNSARQKNAR
jgi:hypothetical protein